jgi:DNA-binding beta-propeller fold protein YncE
VSALPRDLRKDHEAVVAQYENKLQGEEEVNCDRCIETANGPAVSFCVNCCDFLCKVCSKDHKTWRKTLNHELQPVGGAVKSDSKGTEKPLLKNVPGTPLNCEKHSDEVLKFYCETCSMLICRDCIILEHSGHSYNRIESVAEKEKADLVAILGRAEGAKTKLDDAITKGGKIMQQIQAKQKSVEDDIESAFKVLFEALQERKQALLAKAAEISLGKQTALTMQGEEFKMLRDEIAKTCEMIAAATQVYTPAEMLSAKKVMASKLQELIKQYQRVDLEPCRSDMMPGLLDTSELVKKLTSFGVVLGESYPGEAKIDLHIPRAVVNMARKITITAHNIQGKPFPHRGERVNVTLNLMGSSDPPVKGSIEDNKNGTYVATIIPKTSGEHELSITIEGQAAKGSPCALYVRQPREYAKLSNCQRKFETSSQPWGVAVDDNGDVYVANYGYHCISVFNQHGTCIRTIGTAGSSGSGDGQFYYPTSIALRGDVLYIAEKNNHCVQKISTSGKFISKFGSRGSGDGQLSKPRGICLDRDGRVYVSEYNNNRVSVFEADGTFAYHITGNLSNPWGLTFDPSGNLHVTNYSSNYVSIFGPDGKYITQYGSQVTQPAGIAINEEGYTFIAEYYAPGMYDNESRFSILNSNHELIRHVQNFKNASGITVDKEGYAYVCSSSHNLVYKY